jgi:hypothetical protein
MSQTSLGLSGAFCPTSLPLFPGAWLCGLLVHSMMDLRALSRPAGTRRPGAQSQGVMPDPGTVHLRFAVVG